MDGKAAKRVDRMIMCISACVVRFERAESEGVSSEAFWGVSHQAQSYLSNAWFAGETKVKSKSDQQDAFVRRSPHLPAPAEYTSYITLLIAGGNRVRISGMGDSARCTGCMR